LQLSLIFPSNTNWSIAACTAGIVLRHSPAAVPSAARATSALPWTDGGIACTGFR